MGEFETNIQLRALVRKAGFSERESFEKAREQQQKKVVDMEDQFRIAPNLMVAVEFLSDSDDDVEEWFSEYERKTDANLWKDRLRAVKLSDYLKSTALRYWKNCTVDKTNYNLIKAELITLLKVANLEPCHFYMRMQKPGESVADFALSLSSLGKRVFERLSDKELQKTFWTNLLPNIKRELCLTKPENFERAVELAKIIERKLAEQETEHFVKKITQDESTNKLERYDNDWRSNPSITTRRRSRSLSPKRYEEKRVFECYKCGKVGHIARFCRSKRN